MLSIVLTLASLVVVCFVLYRLLPALRGRVSANTETSVRWYRWNTYVSPHIQKYLETQLLVASISSFRSPKSSVQLSISTWSLHPTVIGDVDFIAVANPDSLEGDVSILGFVSAAQLRDVLGGVPEGQPILGHRVWTYVLPESLDRERLVSVLLPPEEFRAHHGIEAQERDEGETS